MAVCPPGLPGDVVEAAMAGDHGALVRLLEITQPDIRRFARQQCRSADADDAVQEALWGTVNLAAGQLARCG